MVCCVVSVCEFGVDLCVLYHGECAIMILYVGDSGGYGFDLCC